MGTLCSVNTESILERVKFMYDVWDADSNDTLTFAELGAHVCHGLSHQQRHFAMGRFKAAWSHLKEHNTESSPDGRHKIHRARVHTQKDASPRWRPTHTPY